MDLLKSFFEASPVTQILLLLVLIALSLREWQRTRRERAERHDTGRLQRIQAEADAEKRRDELLRASLEQNAQYLEQIAHLAQAIQDNTTLESRRIEANERIFKSQNEALVSLTEAQGEGAQRLTDLTRASTALDQGILKLREKIVDVKTTMLDQFGQAVTHVGGKIDTALSKAGDMLKDEIDPVEAALNELRVTLNDVQEKVNHIPELETCLNETNRAFRELVNRLAAERDTAVHELASTQQTVLTLRNALVASDQDKLVKESELARLKQIAPLLGYGTPPDTAQPGGGL